MTTTTNTELAAISGLAFDLAQTAWLDCSTDAMEEALVRALSVGPSGKGSLSVQARMSVEEHSVV